MLVWDAVAGECLQLIHKVTDVPAVAAISAVSPYLVITSVLETAIQSRLTEQAAAWFPATLEHITTHPRARMWAGNVSNHLCLITLEGA